VSEGTEGARPRMDDMFPGQAFAAVMEAIGALRKAMDNLPDDWQVNTAASCLDDAQFWVEQAAKSQGESLE
jgi:hypothetical protein